MKRLLIYGLTMLLVACNGASTTPDDPAPRHEGHEHDDDIAYWTCSMHPSVREAESGTCPICSMDLTPVKTADLESGAVLIDTVRRQRFGVTTDEVAVRALSREVRALGTVQWDESRVHDVTVRVEAWVEELRLFEPGVRVRKGQPMAVLYSPALYSAQRELLSARNTPLERPARERLRLLGAADEQIDAILEASKATDTMELLAPVSGVLVELDVVQGAHLRPGMRLFRVADLDRVWLEAELYEADIPLAKLGTAVRVDLPSAGGATHSGTIDRVEPWVDPDTRRATVRALMRNPDRALLPGMYVDLTFDAVLGEALAVPADAVLFTGRRRIVFVDEGNDRLVPRDVDLGERAGDWFAVESGLELGDTVVTSGNFLVAAESRIRAAQTYWGADHGRE